MRRELPSWSGWAAAAAFFVAGLFPLFNADAYGHLAQGRQIVLLGRIPKIDLFSFWKPEPQAWHNYEWAYDWLTWLAYDHLGPSSLVLAKSVLLGATGFLLVSLSRSLARGASLAGPICLAALLLAIPVARFRFTVRPQIIGLLFPALLLVGISELYSDQATSRRKAWVVSILMGMHVIWVNMHGSHLLGVLIAVVFTAISVRTAAFRWMIALLGLQVAATAATPFGFAIATDAIAHVLTPEYRQVVVEWGPWSARDPIRFLIAPTIAAVFVLLALRPVVRSSRFGLGYGVLCVVLCLMAFRSIRFVGHQLLFCAPFIGAGLSERLRVRRAGRSAAVAVGLSAVLCAFLTSRLIPHFGFGIGEDHRDYPWASAAVTHRHVSSPRIVASLKDSWMLMFAAPSARLLIDGRVPFYGPEMITAVSESFASAERFAKLLTRYDVNTVVIDHTRADHIPATDYLSAARDWGLLFVEDGHSLFVRRDVVRGLEPFEIVAAGYRVGGLLDRRWREDRMRAETDRLRGRPNTDAMQAWHRGILEVRRLARDGAHTGLRMYATEEEQRLARSAYRQFSIAAKRFPGFTTIELYRALAALSACDVERAREALARTTRHAQTRATTLVGLEIAVRAGADAEREQAIAHLRQLRSKPETRDDPWVRAIVEGLETRCPDSSAGGLGLELDQGNFRRRRDPHRRSPISGARADVDL